MERSEEVRLQGPVVLRWARCFNLVSGGPSRVHLTNEDLIPESPVVTVNRAIDIMDRGIQVDFAMFADGPTAMVGQLGLQKYLNPPLQVWVPRSALYHENGVMNHLDMVSQWEPYLPMSVGVRVTPFGFVGGLDGKLRHQFAVLAALERMMMFKPSKIRILCADMLGTWVPGKTEEECEVIQSQLEQFRRNLGDAQKRVNDSKGKDMTAVIMRDDLQKTVAAIEATGDVHRFKRWEHERHALREFRKRATEKGCEVEMVTPAAAVLA